MTRDEWIDILLGSHEEYTDWLHTAEDLLRDLLFTDQADIPPEAQMLLADALTTYISKYIRKVLAETNCPDEIIEATEHWAEIAAETAFITNTEEELDPESRICMPGGDA